MANFRDVTYVIHQNAVIVMMSSKWLLSGLWKPRDLAKVGRVEQFLKQYMKNRLVESPKKLQPKGNDPKYSMNSKLGGDKE